MAELDFTPHPILKPPTAAEQLWLLENNHEGLLELWQEHERLIALSKSDPLRHGFNLTSWTRIREMLAEYNEVLVLGGNRAGKTAGMGKLCMEAVTQQTDGHIVMFSQNADTSIKVQQAAMWEFMPKEFKKKTKSIEGYINFSMQNGFTGQSFIFPDTRTRVDFKTYTQYSNNHTILEGFEFGFPDLGDHPQNIGIVNDEYLGDASLINTQRFRLATRNSKLITGFTPIDGFTALIADYLKGAETLETKTAVLLGGEQVPVKQYSVERDAGICYIHTDENPFGGYERLSKDIAKRSREEILVRAYGVPVKSVTTLFPLFNKNVHVISELPEISKATHTVYQVIDPADARNFFCIWAAVDKAGEVTILREWPDRETHGEWALHGEPKWKHGPASGKLGYAIRTDVKDYSYVELFKEIEAELGVEVFERIGDSRFMAREHDNQDMFSDFAEMDMDVVPSDGRMESSGIQMLDQWFAYNPNIEVDSVNRPKIRIHESCGNIIDSVVNYTPDGKKFEALKDPIDCLRYLRTANGGEGPEHYDASVFNIKQQTGGY